MIPEVDQTLLWTPVAVFLIYTPLVIYLDIKYREIEHHIWTPLILLNLPTIIISVISGNWIPYIPGIVVSVVWYEAMRFHFFEGADFLYLVWISVFFVYNPVSGHWLMVLPFTIFLAACLVSSTFFVILYNLITGKGITSKYDKFPMMIPISAALVLTVALA